MKKLLLYIGMAASLNGCNFLETDTFDELSADNVYNTLSSCEAGLAGVYDPLSSVKLYGGNLILDCDAGSDLMIYNKQYSIGNTKIYLNNYTSVDKTLKETWTELYKAINRANTYIDAIKEKPVEIFNDERTKQRLLAEAKGLRALYYMDLVSLWGEVPLRLTPTEDLSTQRLARSPQIDIYNQIIADLKDAEAGCYPINELDGAGHMSQTTAQALLARAYLWMSGYPVNADKWEEALTYARKVRDSKLHELVQDRDGMNGYKVLFIDMCSDKYNPKESMFEAEIYGNDLSVTPRESGSIGLAIGITQGSGLDPDNGFCYGFYNGSRILFRMYEDTDERKWWNFSDYTFERKVIDENTEKVSKKYRTASELNSFREGDAAKWRREYEVVRPLTQYSTSINVPIMRYSDVLLMLAEAATEVNGAPTQEAVDAINVVRSRAKASSISWGDYDLDSFRELVRDERARELCYEGNRKMDLRRWGKDYFMKRIRMLADQNIISDPDSKYNGEMIGYPNSVSGSYAGVNIKAQPGIQLEDKHIYFPIPETELNVNPICGQNEGW